MDRVAGALGQGGPGAHRPCDDGEESAGIVNAASDEHVGHVPVLLADVLQRVEPTTGQTILDATLGRGGHARAMGERLGTDGHLIGIDLDAETLATTARMLDALACRVSLRQASFADLDAVLADVGVETVDGILADLGFASSQMDDPQRGFSFQRDGPLDMRYDRSGDETAAELVNRLPETDLADLIFFNSQERHSRRIAKAVCRARRDRRIVTTGRLAQIVASAVPTNPAGRSGRLHPATRTFQALRIAVNREMENLDALLASAPRCLATGGRIAVISFHSLEDRRVKEDFRRRAASGHYTLITRKPVTASGDETRANPRARSAKLRVARRTDLPI